MAKKAKGNRVQVILECTEHKESGMPGKKAVATFKKGDGRTYSKVIKMVKSPKTGAYIFQEEMIPNEAVKDYFAK